MTACNTHTVINALTINNDEFTYLTLGSFVQTTPSYQEGGTGVIDSHQLDQQPQLDE